MKISFIVYGEPVAKGRPKFFRRGNFVGTYTPQKTQNAEKDFKQQALDYKPQTPLTEALELEIKVYRSIPKSMSKKRQILAENEILRPTTRPDGDNYLKLCCDALNGIFWRDDSLIVDMRVQKFFSERPRIEVEIKTIVKEEYLSAGGTE
jgi:Holliday junction resolvase RusA-like endonuclease